MFDPQTATMIQTENPSPAMRGQALGAVIQLTGNQEMWNEQLSRHAAYYGSDSEAFADFMVAAAESAKRSFYSLN